MIKENSLRTLGKLCMVIGLFLTIINSVPFGVTVPFYAIAAIIVIIVSVPTLKSSNPNLTKAVLNFILGLVLVGLCFFISMWVKNLN